MNDSVFFLIFWFRIEWNYEMAGKIHRYHVLEESALLPGSGIFPDPDFWSNKEPVMAVCEPQLRAGREIGDWISHVSKKGEVSEGPEYQIAGMLKVNDILDSREIIEGNRFNREWVTRLKLNLAECGHLIEDLLDGGDRKITVAKQRVKNHLIGDPSMSAWFGASGVDIRNISTDIGVDLGSFSGPQTAELSDKDANRLADEIDQRLEEEISTPPNAIL